MGVALATMVRIFDVEATIEDEYGRNASQRQQVPHQNGGGNGHDHRFTGVYVTDVTSLSHFFYIWKF